jgi:acyl-CoA reductase-like NAD-dependent aldehyde dehydrogenase
MDDFFPKSPDPKSLLHASMTSRQRSQGDFDRQMGFLEKAESEGKVVYRGETDATTRRMGFSLVKLAEDGKGESGGLVEQEIFGTVIPIIPYSVSLDSTHLDITI